MYSENHQTIWKFNKLRSENETIQEFWHDVSTFL